VPESTRAYVLVLRGFNLYGDPRPWNTAAQGPNGPPPMPALLAFLNTNKYPASLDCFQHGSRSGFTPGFRSNLGFRSGFTPALRARQSVLGCSSLT
jgi:hypothetical protein